MKKVNKPLLSLAYFLILSSLMNSLKAQQATVDSSLINRVSELEKQVAYKSPGEDHFMVVGLATFGFVYNKTTVNFNNASQAAEANSLADADHYEFSPMLLWRHGQKFLMEFEPSFNGNSIGVNWAAISWFAAPGLIVRAGYFVLPFGAYNKRLAAGWIDKLPTDPTGVTDLPPSSDFGIEAEGGFPLGSMKWNYDVSLTNGMQLLTTGTNAGQMQNAGVIDNNKNKTITGRLGLLPFSNSSLEIGVSGMLANIGDDGSSYQSAKARMYAVDLNYVKLFNPIQVNIKGQYNHINVDEQTYLDTSSHSYTFNNTSTSGFAQVSVRPSGASSMLVKNLEAAFRVGNLVTPKSSYWGTDQTILEEALVYWINWRTAIKFGYSSNKSTNTSLGSKGPDIKSNSLFVQFAIQL